MKIGLFGIGLDTYWDQFPDLKKQLNDYLDIIHQKIETIHPGVINAGLIDNTDKAFEAGKHFHREDVSIIFLYVSTYAVSSTVLPVVQKAGAPVVVLNFSPEKAMDYEAFNKMKDRKNMTQEWLRYCSSCPVPEIANVFKRTGIAFYQITGLIEDDPDSWQEIKEWVKAAEVKEIMSNNRLGCMGHYYNGMLDIYTDLTLQYKYFGGHMEMIEVDELSSIRENVSNKEIKTRVQEFYRAFEIQKNCSNKELNKAAQTSVALDKLVERYTLGSLAYFYKGVNNNANENTISSIILGNSLLTERGIPVAGEYEIKNAQAMKIMDSFDAGGSFTEYYAMDYLDDVVLMGHDGPGHIAIADGKTKVRPLEVYHGKVGEGLSIEMSVKHGLVTLLSVIETADGELKLLTAEGKTVSGPILEIGNTNSRYKFPIGAKNFVNKWNEFGPAHHCAVGVGHISSKIKKLGDLLDMEVVKVC